MSVDTLRADHVGVFGGGPGHTPAIDALAAESLRFQRAYAHSSATVPSMASLLTGRLPAEHGLLGNEGRLAATVTPLAELLGHEGYQSAAFLGNYALRGERGLARGFDTYTREFGSEERIRKIPENRADAITDAALAWLAQARAPFFLWVHYQDPHGPYEPEGYARGPGADRGPELVRSATNSGRGAIPAYQWLGRGHLGEYRERYAAEVAFTDRQIGRLLDGLRVAGALEESIVVFVADHGEAFGEDDLYCAHGEGLGEVLIRVPLLLRAPGLEPRDRTDAVRLTDVVPTLLELLGLPAAPSAGHSLLIETGDRPLVAQLRKVGGSGRWRLARLGEHALLEESDGSRRLTRIDGDPVDPETAEKTARALALLLEQRAPWPEALPPPLDPEEREALRALGYVD